MQRVIAEDADRLALGKGGLDFIRALKVIVLAARASNLSISIACCRSGRGLERLQLRAQVAAHLLAILDRRLQLLVFINFVAVTEAVLIEKVVEIGAILTQNAEQLLQRLQSSSRVGPRNMRVVVVELLYPPVHRGERKRPRLIFVRGLARQVAPHN